MITFWIGIVILLGGGFLYSRYCEHVFRPDNRQTPAYRLRDGVDYVPMGKGKTALIELLNIAGTGPILGPIQGILFGPVAFLLIPIGNVLGGAMHDYFSGMISLRNDGAQMPALIKNYLGKPVFAVYNLFLALLLILVAAVFVYTPGDLFVSHILRQAPSADNPWVWVVYGVIFLYYMAATLLPIDKIIGRIYPVFGAVLLFSAIGVGTGIFMKGYELTEFSFADYPGLITGENRLIPAFFVTVACGIVSGFHSSQATLIGRSLKSEKEGRFVFYYMMVAEGLIAMIWAAAAMGLYAKGGYDAIAGQPEVIGAVAKDLLGSVGGLIAVIGIIVLPITSGDTSLRALRLMVGETFRIDQSRPRNRLAVSSVLFVLTAVILVFAKIGSGGFNVLWRYFAWANQTIAVFAFAMITVYLIRQKKFFPISLLPGMFYMFVISSYILEAKIGFRMPQLWGDITAAVLTLAYGAVLLAVFIRQKKNGKES